MRACRQRETHMCQGTLRSATRCTVSVFPSGGGSAERVRNGFSSLRKARYFTIPLPFGHCAALLRGHAAVG